jgi:hypothetical protein
MQELCISIDNDIFTTLSHTSLCSYDHELISSCCVRSLSGTTSAFTCAGSKYPIDDDIMFSASTALGTSRNTRLERNTRGPSVQMPSREPER